MQRLIPRLAGLLLAAAWFSQGALAQSAGEPGRCDDAVVKSVGKHFALDDFSYPAAGLYPSVENGGLIVAGVCKAWPTNSARVIAAFAYDGGVEGEKDLLLALVETPGNRVVASYRDVISEDAVTELGSYSLGLDTARYTLSKDTRAFGVRLNAFNERCSYDGGFGDELTLYVVEGSRLKPILSETMSRWQYGAGNRCGGEEATVVDAHVLISVEKTTSNGFADLRLSARSNDKRKPPSAIVRYDGERYDLTPWNKVFVPWWDAADPDAR